MSLHPMTNSFLAAAVTCNVGIIVFIFLCAPLFLMTSEWQAFSMLFRIVTKCVQIAFKIVTTQLPSKVNMLILANLLSL